MYIEFDANEALVLISVLEHHKPRSTNIDAIVANLLARVKRTEKRIRETKEEALLDQALIEVRNEYPHIGSEEAFRLARNLVRDSAPE